MAKSKRPTVAPSGVVRVRPHVRTAPGVGGASKLNSKRTKFRAKLPSDVPLPRQKRSTRLAENERAADAVVVAKKWGHDLRKAGRSGRGTSSMMDLPEVLFGRAVSAARKSKQGRVGKQLGGMATQRKNIYGKGGRKLSDYNRFVKKMSKQGHQLEAIAAMWSAGKR